MKLCFYNENQKNTMDLKRVNMFYGYSSSGKTTFSNNLFNGLQGKDKSFTINNTSILKEEKNVIYINSKESIIDHIKLSSKSYLKRLLYKPIKTFFDNDSDLIENINSNFDNINNKLSEICEQFNNQTSLAKINISMELIDSDKIIDNLINISFDYESISSAASKELLFTLITMLKDDDKETHIIIDDFDANLDEQSTINFLNQIEQFDGFFYLFTNKPTSLMYCLGKHSIINIRENKFLDLTNIDYLIRKSIEDKIDLNNTTYEEYMLNYGYIEQSGLLEKLLKQIRISSIYNLGRMLTNKKYLITSTYEYPNICIIPNNENEKSLLEYVDYLINLD